MRLIVLGAGAVTRQLLKRLGEAWEVVVVEPDAGKLSALRSERPFQAIEADGSSRVALVDAGLEEADALVAAGDDDDRNLEAARIALDEKIARVAAVVNDPGRLADFRDISVPAFSASELAARQVELSLEAKRVSSKAFARGRLEAFEFEVSPNAPVRGRPVAELAGHARFVASILRGGELMMPHHFDGVVLEPGDLVTVFGSATELPNMIKAFTTGRARFPLDHGKRVAVVLAEESDMGRPFAEAVTLTRDSMASSLLVVHPGPDEDEGEGSAPPPSVKALLEGASLAAEGVELAYLPVSGSPRRALTKLPEESSVGVIVLPVPSGRGWLTTLRVGRLLGLARDTNTPLLFARGHHSYDRILVAARRTPAGQAAARAAIDIAELSKAQLSGLAVVDPSFVAGADGPEAARSAIRWLKDEASLRGVALSAKVAEGNPVRAFTEASGDVNLVVVGSSESGFFLRPKLATHLVQRSRASILVVPARK